MKKKTKQQLNRQKKAFLIVVAVCVVVILALLITGKQTKNGAGGGVSVKNSPQSQNQQNSSNNNSTTRTVSAQQVAPNQNIVKIPELGLQITVPDSVKDLIYTVKSSSTASQTYKTAFFSTQSLANQDSNCSLEARAPLGALSRVEGQYPTDLAGGTAIGPAYKQFPTFYVSYAGAQPYCSENPNTQTLQKTLKKDFATSLSTIKEL